MEKNSKILVVGNKDIIETSLVAYFRGKGYTQVLSSSEIGIDLSIQNSVYEFFQEQKPEYVFLGSTRSGGIEANIKNSGEFIYHNLASQTNVIYSSWKFGVKKLLYFGASCMYPKACHQPMAEESVMSGHVENTSEAYSVAKIAGVKLAQHFKKQYGFNAICMVPATVYGPGIDTDLQRSHVIGALINRFVKCVDEDKKICVVWGSGIPVREFLYVDDFTHACEFLMDNYDGENLVNVGPGEGTSIKDLSKLIAKHAGFIGEIQFDKTKPDGALEKTLDVKRVSSLGWTSKVDLEDGIKKTIDWYRTAGIK